MLDRETLERRYQTALDILERTGLRVEHDGVRGEIAKRQSWGLLRGPPDDVPILVREDERRRSVV